MPTIDLSTTYLGLTLAHYCSLATFVFGACMAVAARKRALE